MKRLEGQSRPHRGLTAFEVILVVILAVFLIALLLPLTIPGHGKPPVKSAQLEMSQIVNAIHSYQSVYNRLPIPRDEGGSVSATEDFTFGGTYRDHNGKPITLQAPGKYHADNAEVIAILLDLEAYPNGKPTPNRNHALNPQRIKFLNATFRDDTKSWGVGSDGVYRDPWGNPYIITIDLNGDEKCRDVFYCRRSVSQQQANSTSGFDGFVNTNDVGGNGNHFELSDSVMVWSAGPDGKLDPTLNANQGVNRDNVRSWKR